MIIISLVNEREREREKRRMKGYWVEKRVVHTALGVEKEERLVKGGCIVVR